MEHMRENTETPVSDMLRLLIGAKVSLYDAIGVVYDKLSNFEHEYEVGSVEFEAHDVNYIVLNEYGWAIHLHERKD